MLNRGKVVRMEPRDRRRKLAEVETGLAGEHSPALAGALLNAAEGAVQAALECKPDVLISGDFAGRVARLAEAQPAARPSRVPEFARLLALTAAVLAGVALFALAGRATASFRNLAFDLELAVLVQFALLAWWLSTQANRGR